MDEGEKRGGGKSAHCCQQVWECSHALVVDLFAVSGLENLVMKTVGYCVLVKERKKDLKWINSE